MLSVMLSDLVAGCIWAANAIKQICGLRPRYNEEVLGLLGISRLTRGVEGMWHVTCTVGITRKFLDYS